MISKFHNAWGAAKAYFALSKKVKGEPLVIVVNDNKMIELAYADLSFFANNIPIITFPSYQQEPFEEARVLPQIMAARTKTLNLITKLNDFILITSTYAITKKVSKLADFQSSIVELKKNIEYSRDELVYALDILGYIQVEFVSGAGEYNIRGGLADIFPIDAEMPIRIEYFDDLIDDIFYYNPETQGKVKGINGFTLLPASELLLSLDELIKNTDNNDLREKFQTFGKFAGYHWYAPYTNYQLADIFTYLPVNFHAICFSADWKIEIDRFYTNIENHELNSNFVTKSEAISNIESGNLTIVSETSDLFESKGLNFKSSKNLFSFEKKNLYQSLTNSMETILGLLKDNYKVILSIESEKFINIIKEFIRDYDLVIKNVSNINEIKEKGVYLYNHQVSGGFLDGKEKIAMVADSDIFGFSKRKPKHKKKDVFSTSLADLEEGDYVVHVNHGIGIYRGIKHLTIAGVEGDFLDILYDGDDILYVPLQAITQIQKYVGLQDNKPKLSNLNSNTWAKVKRSARESAKSIAEDLLRLYAERKAKKGIAFADDGSLLEEFERTFIYSETEDQLSAIIDVYKDMESSTPMERLVCGDVGFGKTEVAMRAACKAVASSKQVAVLVPTTILARQHNDTFKKRFKDLPVNIDFVSRFRTDKEVSEIFRKMGSGELDILIGTHKILSQKLQFKDLGLLVIDEEQRFGVSHKEKIAAIKRNVDTLTLSATPIPRTLQLSLSGIRDMSIIETPPENRLPVIVKVIKKDGGIEKAIQTELERGGQVFFLHNKVQNIHEVAAEIKSKLPFANVDFAHGQMDSATLEKILKKFYAGEIDVLVSTTIIENGVDIPNVNTILINNAGNFGLSQIYQLKGRVGRSNKRAFCYLVVDDFSSLTPIAQTRLSIIQQLSDLGSGFKIAMYDLQLRGAGNILGADQSGFVVRVGYELYVKMIEEAVSEMKGEFANSVDCEINSQIPYFISAEYIDNPRIRFDYYRRFAEINDIVSMNDMLSELEASYGEIGIEVVNLGYTMLIKSLASKLGVQKVNITKLGAKLEFSKDTKINLEHIQNATKVGDIKYRFINEFELSLSIISNNMILTLTNFFEKLIYLDGANNV